ncbi:SH3 domain-containing protein [Heliophilum fasciatum]|uniref:SH3 domain-containing protein n=2 Tax=Heliophilum fasciatum TaxID=35700 RepID=A0A4R2RVV1_9FIRM|nr:SH3 domain-containing protein [Heliophilum fasciatum]
MAAGFLVGQVVLAFAATPGTSDDPLVARSYLFKAMRANNADLHNQIVALNARVEALQVAVARAGQTIQLPPMPAGYQSTTWTAETAKLGGGLEAFATSAPVTTVTTGAAGATSSGTTPTTASTVASRGAVATTSATTATTPATGTAKTGTITPTGGANVRYGPGTDYTLLTKLPYRTSVVILEKVNGADGGQPWYKVRLANGQEGYVRQDLLAMP